VRKLREYAELKGHRLDLKASGNEEKDLTGGASKKMGRKRKEG